MYLPVEKKELKRLGWDALDIILISGDAYIDSPYDGTCVIGKYLVSKGYKVGVISQPDMSSDKDISRLGEPRLFWGVSAGCVDSMVANYTALKKPKKLDDLTPGEINDKRPDRAVIRYTNLIRQYFKSAKPIVIGGVEASLRRLAHYDYWSDSVRKSILFDSKADALVYGMGERAILELAQLYERKLKPEEEDYKQIRGICFISKSLPERSLEIPSFDEVKSDKMKYIEAFKLFYENNDALNAEPLAQKHDNRYLAQNKPALPLTSAELDELHGLEYEYDAHPYYKAMGKVKALETIQFSINSHRGCYGECNFCAITVHQGRTIISRSKESILEEAERMSEHKSFKGYISDVGGATANMYGNSCKKQSRSGSCKDKRCVFPELCKGMRIDHAQQIELLQEVRKVPGVKKAFVGSGLRYDLVIDDKKNGYNYLKEIVQHHVSGQMKIAPEHISERVLEKMGKPSNAKLTEFKDEFFDLSNDFGKKQFMTYYFIAAHPGCDLQDMMDLNNFVKSDLKINPEQAQIFTPTPSTVSTTMYYTGLDPFTLEPVFVERDAKKKQIQKDAIVRKQAFK